MAAAGIMPCEASADSGGLLLPLQLPTLSVLLLPWSTLTLDPLPPEAVDRVLAMELLGPPPCLFPVVAVLGTAAELPRRCGGPDNSRPLGGIPKAAADEGGGGD